MEHHTDWTGLSYESGYYDIYYYNAIRYRGYYYDKETGFYYLQTRYYDPSLCRFVNSDAYTSTGQGFVGNNMYAYCGNDPVNRTDSSGMSWESFLEFLKIVGSEVVASVKSASYAYAGLGSATLVDGPLPFADIVALAGAGALLLGAVGGGVATAIDCLTSMDEAIESDKELADSVTTDPPNTPTVIYRYGGTNPSNLTPKAKDCVNGGGLSFSTIPRAGAAVTTIEALNATGIVYAVQDGITHVSVYPVVGTVEDWYNAGPDSIWTKAVRLAVVKWIGE